VSVTIEEYADLVGRIYDAALDPQLWPQTMERLAAAVGATAAGLMLTDPVRQRLAAVSVGVNPDAIEAYNRYYWRIDPLAPVVARMPTGLVFTDRSMVPRAELERTELHNDWAQPQGVEDSAFAVLMRDGSSMGAFCLGAPVRADAFGRTDSLRLLQLLVPHLQRAARTQWAVEAAVAGRNVAFAALARLHHGVVLLAAGGKVLFANDAATRLCSVNDGLTIGSAGLRAALPSEDAALQRLFARAFAGNGGGVPAGGVQAVTRISSRRPFAVHVMPAREVADEFIARCPCAVVVIVDPDEPPRLSTRHLQQLYGLTLAEAAVAIRMLRGQGLQSVAKELGVTLSTVRVHLQRVFEKTGAHRQAELVRLLLDMQAGLRPDEPAR
jgi:DNA-binding CsgD family transcriptional regulator